MYMATRLQLLRSQLAILQIVVDRTLGSLEQSNLLDIGFKTIILVQAYSSKIADGIGSETKPSQP